MTALAKDREITRMTQSPQPDYGPVKGSTTIYKGALVCNDTNGLCVPAADSAGFRLKGIARAQADNASGADSAIDVEVYSDGVWPLYHSGLVQGDVGKDVYAVDDQTVALVATTTNDVKVGRIARWISATQVAVDLGA